MVGSDEDGPLTCCLRPALPVPVEDLAAPLSRCSVAPRDASTASFVGMGGAEAAISASLKNGLASHVTTMSSPAWNARSPRNRGAARLRAPLQSPTETR